MKKEIEKWIEKEAERQSVLIDLDYFIKEVVDKAIQQERERIREGIDNETLCIKCLEEDNSEGYNWCKKCLYENL